MRGAQKFRDRFLTAKAFLREEGIALPQLLSLSCDKARLLPIAVVSEVRAPLAFLSLGFAEGHVSCKRASWLRSVFPWVAIDGTCPTNVLLKFNVLSLAAPPFT